MEADYQKLVSRAVARGHNELRLALITNLACPDPLPLQPLPPPLALLAQPNRLHSRQVDNMTPTRAEASRINGAKSRGPKTELGRRAVSLNAVKHGFTAETVVLPSESEAEYEAELREYIHHFAPANKPEADLVRQLASAQWRLVRYTRIEAILLDLEMERHREHVTREWNRIEECGRLALAFEALSGAHSPLALLNRYEARLHYEYQRVLKSPCQMQAARRAAETKLQNEPEAQSKTTQPETRNPVNSFEIPMAAQYRECPENEPPPAWVAGLEERGRAASG